MEDPGNNQIRKLFEELREDDRESAPSFAHVLEGRPARSSPLLSVPVRVAAVLAGLALLVVSFWAVQTLTETPREVAALSAWRAPTDFLLALPGSELLGQPQILEGQFSAWGFTPAEPGADAETGSRKQKEEPEKR